MHFRDYLGAIKKTLLTFAIVFLTFAAPAGATTSGLQTENDTLTAVAAKTKRATLFYARARGLNAEQAQLQAGDFFRLFYTFLEKADSQSEMNDPQTIDALEELLTRYDSLVTGAGTDLTSRESQLEALSLSVMNPSSDIDELRSLKFLKQFHGLINQHYLNLATVPTPSATAPTIDREPIRISPREVAKTIGTYSIWGFCLRTTFYFLTQEYNVHPYLSEPVLVQMAAISLAAGPYSALNQVYLQTEKRIGQSIIEWRKRRREKRNTKASNEPNGSRCGDLFSNP